MTLSIRYRKNIPDPVPLPPAHKHDSDVAFPVIGFDFNNTLTPAQEYPIEAGPYPGAKAVLDELKTRGCCLHIMTAGLYFGKQDIPVFRARQRALQAWCDQYEMPIDFIGGKVPSDCYYDNDYVEVPSEPDWEEIGSQIEQRLGSRFKLVNGSYVAVPHQPIGRPMPDKIPPIEPLEPRGYSTPRLDVDLHKTFFIASSSQRMSPPKPHALEIVTDFYNSGITIRFSCAGWSPMTHPQQDAEERFDGLVWQLAEAHAPYDRIVTKDFHHVGVDDKGIYAQDWERDLPRIKTMLKESERYTPELQWPA